LCQINTVTGKKCRYVPLPSWEDFPTFGGIRQLESLKHMFAFTQWAEGRYFSNIEPDPEPARQLKKAVQEVIAGKGLEQPLMTGQQFFKKFYATLNEQSS
jgi:hypothetical protein